MRVCSIVASGGGQNDLESPCFVASVFKSVGSACMQMVQKISMVAICTSKEEHHQLNQEPNSHNFRRAADELIVELNQI